MAAITFQRQLLERAITIAGGATPLSVRLGVHEYALTVWLEDKATMPGRIFLALADLILEDDIARAAQDRRTRPRLDHSAQSSGVDAKERPAMNDRRL
jgi:hypothetical protein